MTRRVVISAGAAGIGRALADRLAAAGARLAVCDIDETAIARFREDYPDAIAHVADVTDEAQMAAFLGEVESRWGGADLVCANAGTGGPAGPIDELDYQAWQDCVAANLHGSFLVCRWASRVMKEQKQGVILITSSTAGLFGYPMRSPYASAKWALIGLTKTLAMELGPYGVRVNAICPGAVEGPRMERVLERESAATGRSIEETRRMYVNGVSLRSWVTTDDIADMVEYLASPTAKKISGQVVAIDGHTETLVP
ncbi:SDR family oxidoreductase [Aliiroseovarius sp. KMU-50]|uniref:SDR family oxidoreductase n=1 Tax=Aliiroseovarius salicola TaxID=3009082 RepID=A0ABT4W0T0_9RHOB|nr:SDR family oxidoreductase [Aliiroseovarius sp. KMU-50]MDA5094108.1 SDR family oxidoreductase [Aliiroseovarius sp. KMU-50]